MKIDKNAVIAILNAYEEETGDTFSDSSDPYTKDGITITEKETCGGGEGDGEEHWVVIEATNGEETSFWQIPGYYASYDGAYLEVENTYQVEPAKQTITVWNAVK